MTAKSPPAVPDRERFALDEPDDQQVRKRPFHFRLPHPGQGLDARSRGTDVHPEDG